jgi:hypothetical protein
MPLCGSCNRAKSWSCEHCENWQTLHNPDMCRTCYWYGQAQYEHIAMQPIRRLDMVWTGTEVADYEQLQQEAAIIEQDIRDYIRTLLRHHLRRTKPDA